MNELRIIVLALAAAVLAWPARAAERTFDACSLLTAREIEAVQGDRVVSTKSSEPRRDRFAVSQCFYTTKNFARSVSLEVVWPGGSPSGPGTPREQLQKLLHRKGGEARESKGEEEKRLTAPRPIAGIGEEAFWMGNRLVGVLYVLKGDAYFRVSVGGWPNESVRLEKTTALAKNAIRRLR